VLPSSSTLAQIGRHAQRRTFDIAGDNFDQTAIDAVGRDLRGGGQGGGTEKAQCDKRGCEGSHDGILGFQVRGTGSGEVTRL